MTSIQFTQYKAKLTTSDLFTKKETTREIRSSIPTLQSKKVSWLMDLPQDTEAENVMVMDPPQATENTGATL